MNYSEEMRLAIWLAFALAKLDMTHAQRRTIASMLHQLLLSVSAHTYPTVDPDALPF